MHKSVSYVLGAVCLGACSSISHLDGPASASDLNDNKSMQIIARNVALSRDFQPLYPDRPGGPHLYALDGDPKTGPSFTLFRYSRNYGGNFHYHTHNYRFWLIEGEMKHWDADGSEATAPVLQPGAYIFQPANEVHAANCLSDRCTAYVLFDGPIETGLPGDR